MMPAPHIDFWLAIFGVAEYNSEFSNARFFRASRLTSANVKVHSPLIPWNGSLGECIAAISCNK
jgi:hypothetical protein